MISRNEALIAIFLRDQPTMTQLGAQFGISKQRVCEILHSQGIRAPKGIPQNVQEAIFLYAQTHAAKRTAEVFHVSTTTVYTIFRRHGVAYNDVHPRRKLSMVTAEMWALYQQGMRQKDIAQRYQKSQMAISHLFYRYGYLPVREHTLCRRNTRSLLTT